MPKTNEKDAYFFSHDCNARNDPKILALRSVYGARGTGCTSCWWRYSGSSRSTGCP